MKAVSRNGVHLAKEFTPVPGTPRCCCARDDA